MYQLVCKVPPDLGGAIGKCDTGFVKANNVVLLVK
jgi:hypothetical protein